MPDVARYRGALLGVLVGDVLGVPFEGHRGVVPATELALVLADDATSTLRYSDDTAMTMALAESLLRAGGVDEDDLARAFVRHWASGPQRGYSTSTPRLLAALHAGTPWSDAAAARPGVPARASNGAAMRVTSAALYAAGNVEAAAEIARRSARVTHPHPAAHAGACVHAAAVAEALSHPAGVPLDAHRFVATAGAVSDDPALSAGLQAAVELSSHPDAHEIAGRIGTSILASESVPAAICAFLSHPGSFTVAVTLAVSLGGDTDTIAAMTGALAGALLGEPAIPRRWVDRAEAAPQVRLLADGLFARGQPTERQR